MDVIIRKAERGDAEGLFALVDQFATSFRPEREAFRMHLGHLLEDPSAHLSVAQMDDKLIGYCLGFDDYTFYANGRVSWVEEIMVRQDVRRVGVGRALMDDFEVWARSRGSKLVALATRRAASFYTALGYDESATYFRKLLD